MTREEFFAALAKSAKWDVGVAINRNNPVPLDANSVFESYAELENYAKTNPVAHPGQIVSVVGEGGDSIAAYLINTTGESAVITKLAASSASGDIGADVAELQGKVSALEGKVTAAEGKITALEGTVGDDAEGLVKDVADLQTLTGTLSSTLSTVSDDLDALESTVSTLSTNLGGLTASVSANTSSISALTGTVSTISATVSSLGTRLTTAEGEIDALQTQIGSLTGAMHFIGTSTTDPIEGATVSGHEEFESGDVCLFGNKEYVYDGADWLELGDEGSHLTKTEAAATYVPLTRTINGKTLSANVTISSADIADLSATITGAISALDVVSVSVGAGETISAISQTDGVISVTKQTISITQAQVDGLTTALAGKQDTITVSGNGILTVSEGVFGVDTNTYATTSSVESSISTAIEDLDLANTYLGLHAKADSAANADKVANKLTIGSKEFDGSAEVTVTATDLGALTTIPQATAEALGGIKLGHTEGANEHAVVLDGEGKAYVTVSIPAAVTYSAGTGLTLSNNTFAIANGGVTVSMLAGNITDDKITSLDVQKLTQKEEDTLIIDGGTAE